MDVGINLRDLRGSGRLSSLARALGVNEAEALGTLIIVWAETQDRELVVVSEEQFSDSVSLYFDDASKILGAMAKAKLVSRCQPEKWHIHGNEKHVAKLQAFRANASAAGKASATARQRLRSQAVAKPEHIGTESTGNNLAAKPLTPWQHLGNQAVDEPPPNLNGLITKPLTPRQRLDNQGPTLDTGIQDTGDQDHDPDLTSPVLTPISESRSSVSSESQNELALTAPPSAAAVAALRALDPPPPKRKERSAEQKQRSVANGRLYRELYAAAEGHEPTGLDQAFYGAMAKFSDKHAEGAEQILRWVFERCPDKSFRAKGWPLPLIIEQAPRLWRELNNPRAAVESLAAPRQQHQLALAASNDLAFEEYQRRKAERLANAKQV